MSLEELIAQEVRKAVREEFAAQSGVRDLELLTADEVARLCKFEDRHTVYDLKRTGRLKAVSLGPKTIRFKPAEVRRYIEECSEESDS